MAQKSIAEQWAEYVLSLRLSDIPEKVVEKVKVHILDTFACAFGGFNNGTKAAVEAAEADLAGPREATVIGEGRKTSALNALLVNGAMVRFLDANDVTIGGHDSEIIPGAMAVAERQGATGADLIVATVAGYELAARFRLGAAAAGNAVNNNELEARGFNSDLRAGYVMPAVFGRLLGLDRAQIANAIGTSGSRSLLLGIVDASKEQNTLAKNIRFPLGSYQALVCTFLAQAGLTGPARVIEGHMGLNETILSSKMDLGRLTDFGEEWFTMKSSIKGFSACYATHGQLQAAVNLRHRTGLDPADIESIRLVTNSRSLWHTGDPDTRRRVDNKETADHSSYYVVAIALLFGTVAPEHYRKELYTDQRVTDLMDKISIEADDATYKASYPGSRIEIQTRDARYAEEALYPRGHYLNPMTEQEVERKFASMAAEYLSQDRQQQVIAAVWNLEDASDLSELTRSLAADR